MLKSKRIRPGYYRVTGAASTYEIEEVDTLVGWQWRAVDVEIGDGWLGDYPTKRESLAVIAAHDAEQAAA